MPNKNVIGIIGVFVVIISIMLVYIFKDQLPLQKKHTGIVLPNVPKQHVLGRIAQVGNEALYQSDLDTEIRLSPPIKNIDMKKFLLNKLIEDSIILQGAAEDNLISLDASTFNASNKDYDKRILLIKSAMGKLQTRANTLSGTIISIWFYNGAPGPLGYDNGKVAAYQKIAKLHDNVKAGKLTINQALEVNRNDTTRELTDISWQTNPGFIFSQPITESITFDPEFDATVKALPVGQLSGIFVLHDKNTHKDPGRPVEVLYAFAQLSDKKLDDNMKPFDTWLNDKRQKFAITYE